MCLLGVCENNSRAKTAETGIPVATDSDLTPCDDPATLHHNMQVDRR